jgi:hypothetical protein
MSELQNARQVPKADENNKAEMPNKSEGDKEKEKEKEGTTKVAQGRERASEGKPEGKDEQRVEVKSEGREDNTRAEGSSKTNHEVNARKRTRPANDCNLSLVINKRTYEVQVQVIEAVEVPRLRKAKAKAKAKAKEKEKAVKRSHKASGGRAQRNGSSTFKPAGCPGLDASSQSNVIKINMKVLAQASNGAL